MQGIKDALKGQKLEHAYDAVSEKGSYQNLAKVLDQNSGRIHFVLPPPGGDWNAKFEGISAGIHQGLSNVGTVHQNLKDLGFVYCRYFTRGLEEGWFRGQKWEVVPGGLAGVQSALERLKDGSASAVKYVFRIADTEGAGSAQ